MNYENVNVHLKHKNYEKVKILFAIQEYENILFAIHELWRYENICLQYMNYENIFAIHNSWKHENICLQNMNLKTQKCPFETHELWKNLNLVCKTWIMKTFKCLFTIHELLKYLFALNYEKKKSLLQYMNYEIFVCIELWKQINVVCNTRIMKMLFAIHELWKYPFETHELWKN